MKSIIIILIFCTISFAETHPDTDRFCKEYICEVGEYSGRVPVKSRQKFIGNIINIDSAVNIEFVRKPYISLSGRSRKIYKFTLVLESKSVKCEVSEGFLPCKMYFYINGDDPDILKVKKENFISCRVMIQNIHGCEITAKMIGKIKIKK